MDLFKSEVLNGFIDAISNFNAYHKTTIPLCAAENIMSPFSKLPLNSSLQERYIMNGVEKYSIENNFIGSEYLHPFYELINKQCNILFKSTYSDARTLSGLNCITSVLMSLAKQGDTIMLSSPDCGGHPSIPDICCRLGLEIVEMPYNYDSYDFDYDGINTIIKSQKIDMIVIAPSDIIFVPQLDKIKTIENNILVYDATQTLGLIAGKIIPNPLMQNENVILIGGTHKTLPGPTCGLIMTRNSKLAEIIDKTINPKYLRNTQMHQIASLLLTLIEMEYVGQDYQNKIVSNSNALGKVLELHGFAVASANNIYSETHQIFIHLSKNLTDFFYRKAIYFGITLNKKEKMLFRNTGLRLGSQEITRYDWDMCEIEIIGKIFSNILKNQGKVETEHLIKSLVDKKQIFYCFDKTFVEFINNLL